MLRRLTMLANPFSRAALLAFAWSHRRTIMRWGRTLTAELKRSGRIDPGRLQRIGRILWAISSDDDLAGAKQLQDVRLDDQNRVVLRTARNWRHTARLVDKLASIDGVTEVVDPHGTPMRGTIEATAR